MAIPLPDLVAWQGVAAAAFRALVVHRRVESTLETSAVFEVDWWLTVLSRPQVNEAVHNFWRTLRLEWEEQVVAVGELDRLALEAYLLDGSSVSTDNYLNEEIGYIAPNAEIASKPGQWNTVRFKFYFDGKSSSDDEITRVAARLVSVALGLAMGRWKTNGTRQEKPCADRLFEPWPITGSANDLKGTPILVDDEGGGADIVAVSNGA